MLLVAEVPTPPTIEPHRPLAPGQRLVLEEVDWQAYQQIGEALRDRSNLRLTFDRGTLEIMTTSHEHERLKARIGRFLQVLAEEWDLEIAPGGSMTFQRQDMERGLEPDECFWIAHEARMRSRREWDPQLDPPPDLVLEIEVSRAVVDRLELYAALGVPEVWRVSSSSLQVLRLRGGAYSPETASPTFPGIPVEEIPRLFLANETEGFLALVRAFRAWVREQRGGS